MALILINMYCVDFNILSYPLGYIVETKIVIVHSAGLEEVYNQLNLKFRIIYFIS